MAYIALSLRKYIILLIVSIDTDGLIEDFCDGTRFSKYSLFSTDPYALQVIAYYDELEICVDLTVFHPTWVRRNGILYKSNNSYLIIKSDGLDPIFGQLDDILVVGGDQIFQYASCCILILTIMPM